MMTFGTKSVIALKKNSTVNSSIFTKLLKTKIRSYGDEATDFQSTQIPETSSNYICWSVTLMDSVLEKN